MNWGMIVYEIPLTRYPKTYNGQPLCYAGLAARKNFSTLYLMGAYADPRQAKALKKLDMGKSCLHFKRVEDLELGAIGKAIASTPPDELIARYEQGRRR